MEKDLHNDHIVSKNKDSYAFIHRYIVKITIIYTNFWLKIKTKNIVNTSN